MCRRTSRKNLLRDGGGGPETVGGARENVCVTESPLAAAERLFAQAVDALRGVAEAGSADERVSVLTAVRGRGAAAGPGHGGHGRRAGPRRRVRRARLQVADAGVERSARLGALRGPPPGERRRAGRPADRAGRQRVAGPAARDRAGVRAGPDESAPRRGDRPAAGQPAGRAAEPDSSGPAPRRSSPARRTTTPRTSCTTGARRWSSCSTRTAKNPTTGPPPRPTNSS